MEQISKIYCINMRKRTDRKKRMIEQAKKFNLKIEFFNACVDKDGWKGCLQSHIEVLRIARKKKLKNVLILEDDCEFYDDFSIPKFPEKWDMLYLSGNCKELYEDYRYQKEDKWIHASMATTHCYLVNGHFYSYLINKLKKCRVEVDTYYMNFVHKDFDCYIINNFRAKQYDCYSDIEKRVVKYHLKTPEFIQEIEEVEYENKNGQCIVKCRPFTDEELPCVSILTPTYGRKDIFKAAIDNFRRQIYPREKLQWIIIDDSIESMEDILPDDDRIKYIKINSKKKLTIAHKRNLCVEYADYDYLVHMDDDDYYFDDSVLNRIKLLLNAPPGVDLLGCGRVACYDFEKSFIGGVNTQVAEASMVYRRSYYEERGFDKRVYTGEGKLFTQNRKHRIRMIPFSFIMIVINHKKNVSGTSRHIKDMPDLGLRPSDYFIRQFASNKYTNN